MNYSTKILLALLCFGFYAPQAFAQMEILPGVMDTCYAHEFIKKSYVKPRKKISDIKKEKISSIQVNYSGFTTEARNAFQFAVDIWEAEISSSVPIIVNASFEELSPGVLGSAGSASLLRDFPNAPEANTFYPVALANALAGEDLSGAVDINARFNSNFDFYFGTDGNPPSGQFDFVSIVLHEIGHGLGFFGSAGRNSGNGLGAEGTDGEIRPYIYDLGVVLGNGSNPPLVFDFEFEGSQQSNAITSNNLFCNSVFAVAANNNERPQIFAPNPFNPGSSYSHWNESSFPPGNINSLMSPQFGPGEAIHDVGPITRGLFQDMGWELAEAITDNLQVTSIDVLVEDCDLSSLTPVAVTVLNTGTRDQSDFNLVYEIRAENGDLIGSGSQEGGAINSTEGKTVNLSLDLSLNNGKFFRIIARSDLNSDQVASDNERAFNVRNPTPTIQASNLIFDNSIDEGVRVQWTGGDGERKLVLVKENTPFEPEDFILSGSYAANSNYSLAPTTLPDGDVKVVYRGSVDQVLINSLQVGATYYIAVIEYSCSPEVYLTADPLIGNNVVTDLAETRLDLSLKTFPNPSQEKLEIQLNGSNYQFAQVELLNQWGESVQKLDLKRETQSWSESLDVQALPKGIYYLRTITNKASTVRKIIVE